jgi:hypothetical protein
VFLTSYVVIYEDCCANLVERENQAAITARRRVEEDEDNYTEALKSAYVVLFPPEISKLLFLNFFFFYKQLYELGIRVVIVVRVCKHL